MDVIGRPLALVRQAMAATGAEFPGVTAGLTGRPVLQADEMETTNRDMTKASVIAVIVIALLFIIVLHGWRRPLMVVVTMLLAIGWTFGFATVAVGELNLLSIVFTLVLVGIGVDFGVHLVSRALEAGRGGDTVGESVETALRTTGPGITLGCLTSVCAFYSVLGSDFVGLAELGLIGGTGMLLSLLATLVVLPALLLIVIRRHPPAGPRVITMHFLERVTARPALLLVLMTVATLGAVPGLYGDHFDYNLLKLQAQGLESVKYERLLISSTKESTWYAIMVADSLEEVRRRRLQLQVLPSVGTVETILDYLPENQTEKMALYAGAARALQAVPARPAAAPPPRAAPLTAALEKLDDALAALQEKLFAAGAGEEVAQVEKLLGHIEGALDLLAREPSRAAALTGLQKDLRQEVDALVQRLRVWLTAGPLTAEHLPPALRDLFVGRDGRYQIKITPSANIWDFAKLQTFVGALRQIDPQVSGTPIAVLESARLMHHVFLYAAALTVALVTLLLWLSSRSLVYVVLALLPLGVGILWLLELMGLLGINFNLANFFAIPILIAIGVDGGVHFLARWREMGGQGNLFATSTPTAVTLSFTTTMIGFSGLLLAHHQGLASLGAVMVLGSLTCMVATLLVLPMVLKLLGHRWR